jgi:DnaK suppressor protein
MAAKKASKKVAKKTSKKKVTKAQTTKTAKKATTKVTKKTTKKVAKKVTKASAASNENLIHGVEPYKAKAREPYMSEAQVAHFREILVSWKRNLIEEVSRTIHLMQDENINHPDPNDRASQETDMSLELRNRDRERKLLKKIDSTITRLDNDDYGWCDRCGVEIGIRRLEARPTAELCVDCKTLNEIKERQMI